MRARRARLAGAVAGAVAVSIAASAVAAPVGSPIPADPGPPLGQTMLGGGASFVRTEGGDACVASATIDIAASDYRASDGAPVAFETVVRSRATSAQYVGPTDGSAPFFRVQFKYSLRPGAPATLRADAREIDIARLVEPTTDSVVVADPADVAAIRAALAGGEGIVLTAVSRDTGRRVTDRLDAMSFAAFDACMTAHAAIGDKAAPPSPAVSIEIDAAPTPETRVTVEQARACQMTDPGAPIHRGLIRRTTGFFAQTQTVYAGFDAAGRIVHLYVPGVFEARTNGSGEWAAEVSRAADANAPQFGNRVSGCLGAAPVPLCDLGGADGARLFGPCPGDMLLAGLFDDAIFLVGRDAGQSEWLPDGATLFGSPASSPGEAAGGAGGVASRGGSALGGLDGGGFGAAGFGGGGGSGGARSAVTAGVEPVSPGRLDEDPEGPPMAIPLPAAIWLLGGALLALGALRRDAA